MNGITLPNYQITSKDFYEMKCSCINIATNIEITISCYVNYPESSFPILQEV